MTLPLLQALVEAGADIIELGVPFSDPMADGPTIQRASERALKHGVGLKHVLAMVAEFRVSDATTPVVLMGYANPIEAMGAAVFAERAQQSGVDGVIMVDCPPEECVDAVAALVARRIDPIFLLSPTTTDARASQIAGFARGYLYYVSLKGVTGAAHLDLASIEQRLEKIRSRVALPIGVGFGIRDAETARAIARFADAVVIGSRLVEEIEASPRGKLLDNVKRFVSGIRIAMDQNLDPD